MASGSLIILIILASSGITANPKSTTDNIETTSSHTDHSTQFHKKDTVVEQRICSQYKEDQIVPAKCPSDHECSKLGAECMECQCSSDCKYGKSANASCTVPESGPNAINCTGPRNFTKSFVCQYCYQSNRDDHKCSENFECNSVADPNTRYYRAECEVPEHLICLGNRKFLKQLPCNWTGGYRWTTALALSITLGGFGADRFYLGHWQEGIGKLFSFGGLGVWTLVDVVMVAIRYIGPADGSLYI